LSTIESVYTVINLLKKSEVEHCDTKVFLIPFEKMIEYKVEYILNPTANSYRVSAKREIIPKDRYKKKAQRTIIFKQES
jgi:hypothetical protein